MLEIFDHDLMDMQNHFALSTRRHAVTVSRMWNFPASAADVVVIARRSKSSHTEEVGCAPTYLHVGPGGDCWTGPTMFAAKHLQPDYVQSIELPREFSTDLSLSSSMIAMLEEDPGTAQQIYDAKALPEDLLERIQKYQISNENK